MQPGPLNNTSAFSQSYSKLFIGNIFPINLAVTLAASTDSVVYQTGVILAQYTAGANTGKFVNYKSGASNGQGTAVAILWDDNIVNATSVTGLVTAGVPRGGVECYYASLIGSVSGDVDAAITQLGGIKVLNAVSGSVTTVTF